MDGTSFDALARRLSATGPRRGALRALAAGLVAGSLGWRGEPAAAATCNVKANGDRCTSGGECCSGRCKRKKGTHKKFCRKAPGQGICTVADNVCDAGSPSCNVPSTPQCLCYVAENGFSFCGRLPEQTPDRCFKCNSDADCKKRPGAQAGDHCVYCIGTCTNNPSGNTNGTACISKCPNPA
jgi:hypothetical protein